MPDYFTNFPLGLKTYRLPGWLGVGCGAWAYSQVNRSDSQGVTWPEFTSAGTAGYEVKRQGEVFSRVALHGEGVANPLCPEPNQWYWFVTHPNSPQTQKVPLDWVRHGYGTNPFPIIPANPWWFPDGSLFYLPDFDMLLKWEQTYRHARYGWGWQGVRWQPTESGGLFLQWAVQDTTQPRVLTQHVEFSPADLEAFNFLTSPASLKTFSRAEGVSLYYSLREFVRTKPHSNEWCTAYKPNPTTPRGLVKLDEKYSGPGALEAGAVHLQGMVGVWEEELRKRIYDVRRDLHTLTGVDPATGLPITVPLLMPPDSFPSTDRAPYVFKCPSSLDLANMIFGAVISIFTLGAPLAVTLPLTLTQALVGFTSQLDAAGRLKKIQEWEKLYLPGITAALNDPTPGTPPLVENEPAPNNASGAATGKGLAFAAAIGLALWLLS